MWDDQLRTDAGNGVINLGWKHALCFPCEGIGGEIMPDDIGFVIVRDSVSWIPRMMLETYESTQSGLSDFFRVKPVIEFMSEPWFEEHSRRHFGNILDMRSRKYQSWMRVAEAHPNVRIIRYEDLTKDNGKELVAQLCKANPTFTCRADFSPVLPHVKYNIVGAPLADGWPGRAPYHEPQPTWSAVEMSALMSGLDMSIERKLGYFPAGTGS